MEKKQLITFKEFLESYPEKTLQQVSEFYYSKGNYWKKSTPSLTLFCEICDGIRVFDGEWECGDSLNDETEKNFLTYECRNCKEQKKTYCLMSELEKNGNGRIVKIGEFPTLHSDIPKSLKKILGEDYNIFLKGLRCEKLGLGIGALTYYRRIVESQKNHLFTEILHVAEKLNAPEKTITKLKEATTIQEFSRAVETVKQAIPESLLVDNHNPMKLLYKAMSIGVHVENDDNCLKIAYSIRVVLTDLSIKIQAALKNQKAVKSAISKLLSFNGKKNNSQHEDK